MVFWILVLVAAVLAFGGVVHWRDGRADLAAIHLFGAACTLAATWFVA